MKKLLLAALLCGGFQAVLADGSDYLDQRQQIFMQNLHEYNKEFNEMDVPLPAVPNPNEGDWFELYIDNLYKGSPRILLSSITQAPDGSVRYVFNNRSEAGYDNITAEGMLCVTGTKLLDSEGSKLKTYGYADLVNPLWIEPRNAQWTTQGGKRNETDRVRRVLYDAFCLDTRARSSDETLRARIRTQGKTEKREYGK
mgnify:CR=1 FL=1